MVTARERGRAGRPALCTSTTAPPSHGATVTHTTAERPTPPPPPSELLHRSSRLFLSFAALHGEGALRAAAHMLCFASKPYPLLNLQKTIAFAKSKQAQNTRLPRAGGVASRIHLDRRRVGGAGAAPGRLFWEWCRRRGHLAPGRVTRRHCLRNRRYHSEGRGCRGRGSW